MPTDPSLDADRSNTGASGFTSSGLARPSDAPVEQNSLIATIGPKIGSIFGSECPCPLGRSACSSLPSAGGRCSTAVAGSPANTKNCSRSTGAHIQGRRAGLSDLLLKQCGAMAGMLAVEPAGCALDPTAKGQLDRSPWEREHHVENHDGTAAGETPTMSAPRLPFRVSSGVERTWRFHGD
jgi:hypothetical protein